MNPGEIHVWLVHIDKLRDDSLPEPTPGELARADRFSGVQRRRYLKCHRAMRSILGGLVDTELTFAVTERGKPYLASAPHLKFNVARSKSMAIVAAAIGIEVGADIERLHPLTDYMGIAERFLPPVAAAEFAAVFQPDPEREFFRRYTRSEAMLKATGEGLYGLGKELDGEWTVLEVDAGPRFAAAVAAPHPELQVQLHTLS